MNWTFKSWLPLVNKLMPTDDVKLWKRGSSLRMDSTLLGFSGTKWKRGECVVMHLQLPTVSGSPPSCAPAHSYCTCASARVLVLLCW